MNNSETISMLLSAVQNWSTAIFCFRMRCTQTLYSRPGPRLCSGSYEYVLQWLGIKAIARCKIIYLSYCHTPVYAYLTLNQYQLGPIYRKKLVENGKFPFQTIWYVYIHVNTEEKTIYWFISLTSPNVFFMVEAKHSLLQCSLQGRINSWESYKQHN